MQLADLAWPAVQALDKDVPVVFPVAALEQHGQHLPVFTDSLLLGEIVRRVAPRFDQTVLFAPLMWLGNSHHHMDFAGTLSAPPRVYLDLIGGLANNFIAHGFRHIVFVNGHGGNDVPGRQALFELRQEHRGRSDLLLIFATYWNLAKPHEICPDLHQKEMGHACEWETSMVLRIAPHLVGQGSAGASPHRVDAVSNFQEAEPHDPGKGFAPGFRAWITKDRTAFGHLGFPHLANATKGEALLKAFADGLADFLQRVISWNGKDWNG